MEPGNVVEFIDNQKIFCAVVLEIKKLRLRVLTENNREVKISVGRLAHRTRTRLNLAAGRDKLVAALKQIAAKRRTLSETIDTYELWEVLNSEQEWIDLPTMTAFCFPDDINGDRESAVMRAFFNDRLYFRFNPDRFFPNTEEKVAKLIQQQQAAEHQQRMICQGADWLKKVLNKESHTPPPEAKTITDILASYYLHENESPHKDIAKTILKKTGAPSLADIFSFMVGIGDWSVDENLDLLRYHISTAAPATVLAKADTICRNQPRTIAGNRRDLRHLSLITIDGQGTLDFDDALSIEPQGDAYLLGIHIADVAHYIMPDDVIDREALGRASSIYMPDQRIPMLPRILSEDLCSLKAGQPKPAISTLVKLTSQAQVIDFEIVPSVIQVKQQLTYQDVDLIANEDTTIHALHTIAQNYRQRRLKDGALIIDLPEINISFSDTGKPVITRANRETPGRLLVAELMIMANVLAARCLVKHGLPAIFRSQPQPRERLYEQNQGTIFQNWMQRKRINRFVLSSTPEPHAGLGVKAYVTATSPIRKYSDLITQRQLRAVLGLQKPYTPKQTDFLIAALQEPMEIIARTQYRRHRYWLLKHLQSCIGQKEEALVLNKRRQGYAILLLKYMLECHLSGAEQITLKPEDLIQVTIQQVNARNDTLTIIFG